MTRLARFLALAAVLALACNRNPTSPNPLDSIPRGTLNGVVTIGPNCPVTTTAPCPTPPSAYGERTIQIWDEPHAKIVANADIDNGGFYTINLTPGTYVVDLKAHGIDKSADVPAKVVIKQNQTTRLNISIDTGIR